MPLQILSVNLIENSQTLKKSRRNSKNNGRKSLLFLLDLHVKFANEWLKEFSEELSNKLAQKFKYNLKDI